MPSSVQEHDANADERIVDIQEKTATSTTTSPLTENGVDVNKSDAVLGEPCADTNAAIINEDQSGEICNDDVKAIDKTDTRQRQQQHLEQGTQQQSQTDDQNRRSKIRSIASHPTDDSSNSLSATTAILGSTSDRNDFLPKDKSYKNNTVLDTADTNETENGGGIINEVKKWFAASADEPVDHDYIIQHAVDSIGSALKSNKASARAAEIKQMKSLDGNDYDSSLLEHDTGEDLEMSRQRSSTYDETIGRRSADTRNDCPNEFDTNEGGDGKSKFKYANGWGNNKTRNRTDDELRVMGECSFFYDGMDNEESHSPSHQVTGVVQDADEKDIGYFREGHPHKYHRTRVINPRAMAHAISSSARRQWTERRYRRRLKQSTFAPPQSMWNNRHPQQQQAETPQCQMEPAELPTYELTKEHRQAFIAAHSALNDKLANEYSRNKHAINIVEYGYDLDVDLDLNLAVDDDQKEEIRSDLTKSSLAIRGSGQIRLPIDNVRLVMDSHLQPGILSVESRAGTGYMGYENYGNANRYGNINAREAMPLSIGGEEGREGKKTKKSSYHRSLSEPYDQPWRRNELSYVLTVDDSLYQRLFQEISDSYRLPFGMYYCCHVVESEASHDHVGIGVAILILLVVFLFLVVGMLIWPMD
jgi:hypothetical protein